MTSDESGAIAIFHLYGGEAQLSSRVDILLRAKSGVLPGSPLELHELRYGWLYPPSGSEAVDEVMLAKPLDGIRVLMTHGGGMVTGTVGETCRACGFVHYTNGVTDGASGIVDQLEDPILSHCLTEAQAAAVLRWRSGGEAPSPGLLATHRVVLAGPPNAGKSSLLNQLSGYDRAFVHPEAGATRDVVDELVEVGGYALWVGDLPGFSEAVASRDHLAGQAWRRAAERLIHSEMVWFVVDASQPWEGETEDAARIVADILAEAETPPTVLVVANKADLPSAWDGEPWRDVFPSAEGVWLSSLPQGDAIAVLGTKASTLW